MILLREDGSPEFRRGTRRWTLFDEETEIKVSVSQGISILTLCWDSPEISWPIRSGRDNNREAMALAAMLIQAVMMYDQWAEDTGTTHPFKSAWEDSSHPAPPGEET